MTLDELGCGDNSCQFKKPGGMGTNGGCGCYENAGFKKSGMQSAPDMLKEVLTLRARVAELEKQIVNNSGKEFML